MIILTDLSEVFFGGLYDIVVLIERHYGHEEATRFLAYHQAQHYSFTKLMRGIGTEESYWTQLIQSYGFPFSVADIMRLFSANIAKDIPGTLDTYNSITGYVDKNGTLIREIPVFYAVSDHISSRKAEIIAAHPDIFSLVNEVFWSCDIRMVKRDPGYFKFILNKIQAEASDVILIDDDPRNIAAAKKDAGINGIVFQNAVQLKEDLEKNGIVFA